MKCHVLFINRDKSWDCPPTPLRGWSQKQYGTAPWSQPHNKQVCRVPLENWSQAMEEDITKLSHLLGNVWMRGFEFECLDGTRFTTLQKAMEHEDEFARQNKIVESGIVKQGITITREEVEQASAGHLRNIAAVVKMPAYRKLHKVAHLRPALLTFLGYGPYNTAQTEAS